MESYQCLVIGISRYQFFPPLNHGEGDAKAIYQFFRQEVNIPERQLLLLSDTSGTFSGLSAYPNGDNLLNWLKLNNIDRLNPQNTPLWFFFLGYGLNYQGEDYLMPIDGNPQDVAHTGIRVSTILDILQQQTDRPILVILNLYLSGSPTKVGQQSINLAKHKKIGLIFSLRQSSETTLSQGIFTSALLEALRYYRREITLSKLAQYLGDRLPSISFSGEKLVLSPIVISPSLAFSSQSLFASIQREKLDITQSDFEPLKQSSTSSVPQPISAINVSIEDKSAPNFPLLPALEVTHTMTQPEPEETIPMTTYQFFLPSSVKIEPPHDGKWLWLGEYLCY